MVESTFTSPAYSVQRINIDDLVSQKANPNSMTGKSWEALQTSIRNTGYTFPVIAATNTEFDPSTAGQERPNLLEVSDGEETFTDSGKVGTQVSDDEIARYFPYRLIDGSHRTQIIRQGKWWFEHGYDHSDKWSRGENIPEKPGLEMLAYLAWRENFSVPAVLLTVDATTAMSAEILHNPIWEDQRVTVMRKDGSKFILHEERNGQLIRKEVKADHCIFVKQKHFDDDEIKALNAGSKSMRSDKGIQKQIGEYISVSTAALYDVVAKLDDESEFVMQCLDGNEHFRLHRIECMQSVPTEILWKDLQVGDVFAEDFDTKWKIEMLSGEVVELSGNIVPIRARWNADGSFTRDPECLIYVPVAELKLQVEGGRPLAYAGSEECIDRTIFEITGGPSIVTGLDEWTEKECYELQINNSSMADFVTLSKDHLIQVDLRLLDEVLEHEKFGSLQSAVQMSKEGLQQVEEKDQSWLTVQAVVSLASQYRELKNKDDQIKGVRFDNSLQLNDHLVLIDAKDVGVKRCRCISTSRGTYTVSGITNHNTARGSHSLESMKDIVANLINVAGMSEEWVSQNLYLDVSSIQRMMQLSGLKASMTDIDDTDLAWRPEADDSYGRKLQAFLSREATKYIELYKQEHEGDAEVLAAIPTVGTSIDIALALGFDQEAVMKRHGEEYKYMLQD